MYSMRYPPCSFYVLEYNQCATSHLILASQPHDYIQSVHISHHVHPKLQTLGSMWHKFRMDRKNVMIQSRNGPGLQLTVITPTILL